MKNKFEIILKWVELGVGVGMGLSSSEIFIMSVDKLNSAKGSGSGFGMGCKGVEDLKGKKKWLGWVWMKA